MSKSRREIQEQLQKDEVAETLQNIANNIRDNRNLLVTIAIVIVLGALSIIGLRTHNASQRADQNAKLNAALRAYQEFASQPDPKQREEALKGAVAAADQLAGSRLGHEALYIKGNAYYAANKFTDAQTAFQAYVNQAGDDQERARGEIALGYAYENEAFFTTPPAKQVEKLTTAMTHYVAAANAAAGGDTAHPKDPYIYYYALLCEARVNELLNKDADAAAIYERIIKERPEPVALKTDNEPRGSQDMLAQMIRKQLEEAEGQMSFQATAKLRLERLRSTPKTSGPVTTEVQVPAAETPAPAATTPAPATTTPKPAATTPPKAAATTTPAPTATPSPTVTPKPTATATPSPTPKPTATPTPKPSPTATPAATAAPQAKPAAPAANAATSQPAAKK